MRMRRGGCADPLLGWMAHGDAHVRPGPAGCQLRGARRRQPAPRPDGTSARTAGGRQLVRGVASGPGAAWPCRAYGPAWNVAISSEREEVDCLARVASSLAHTLGFVRNSLGLRLGGGQVAPSRYARLKFSFLELHPASSVTPRLTRADRLELLA